MKALTAVSISLLFSAPAWAAPELPHRIVLGVSRPLAEQVWILQEAGDSYYVKVGKEARPLESAFPHLPYPLAFVEFRLHCPPTPGCQEQAPLHIVKLNNERSFNAAMSYALSKTDAGYHLDIGATQLSDPTHKASLSLDFASEEVLVE